MDNKNEIILQRILNRHISGKIVKLIEDRRLTAYQLMMDLQINKSTFYRCLNGERDWSIENLIKIADYFHVSLDFLIRIDPVEPDKRVKQLEEEKQELQEENERLRSFVSRSAELLNQVEILKKSKHKKKK